MGLLGRHPHRRGGPGRPAAPLGARARRAPRRGGRLWPARSWSTARRWRSAWPSDCSTATRPSTTRSRRTGPTASRCGTPAMRDGKEGVAAFLGKRYPEFTASAHDLPDLLGGLAIWTLSGHDVSVRRRGARGRCDDLVRRATRRALSLGRCRRPLREVARRSRRRPRRAGPAAQPGAVAGRPRDRSRPGRGRGRRADHLADLRARQRRDRRAARRRRLVVHRRAP